MPHKVFTKKDGSTWKQVRRIYVKEDVGHGPEWKRIRKGWVKVSNTSWKLFFAEGLPKGIILPFNNFGGHPIPDGWSEYTKPGTRLIIGADSKYPVHKTGGDNHITYTGRMATAGSHKGNATNFDAQRTCDIDCKVNIDYDGDPQQGYWRGGHHHNSHTAQLNVEPYNTHFKLIKLNEEGMDIPNHTYVFSVADMMPFGFGRILSNHGKYFSSGSRSWEETGTHKSTSTWTTNTEGSHVHSVVCKSAGYASDDTHTYPSYQGAHHHTGKITAETEEYKHILLAFWYSAENEIKSAPGMIGMWEGVTPPEGWAICNGSNGTPDLRNKFIKFANQGEEGRSGGTNKVKVSTFAGLAGSHNHVSTTNRGCGETLTIRHSTNVEHQHPDSVAYVSHIPRYYSLSFIMKLPE